MFIAIADDASAHMLNSQRYVMFTRTCIMSLRLLPLALIHVRRGYSTCWRTLTMGL